MKLKEVKFFKSVSINDSKVFFDDKDEIVFVGRSNVWKSSLMNALLNKKDLVKTSSKPGKTRTANLFLLNNKYFFTDLPGYGFAKLWKQLKEDLDSLISWYVSERKSYIKKVVLIIDSKIWPQQTDIDMFNYINDLEIPVLIILSKVDRLSNNDVNKSIFHCEEVFFGQQVMAVSSMKKLGVDEIFKVLAESF